MISRQAILQNFERFFGSVDHLKQFAILWRNGALVDQEVEIHYLFPVRRAVDHNRHLLSQLPRLCQRQQFEHLVDRAKSAGKNHEGLAHVRKPVLPHEEVVKFEIESRSYVAIWHLFETAIEYSGQSFCRQPHTRLGSRPP